MPMRLGSPIIFHAISIGLQQWPRWHRIGDVEFGICTASRACPVPSVTSGSSSMQSDAAGHTRSLNARAAAAARRHGNMYIVHCTDARRRRRRRSLCFCAVFGFDVQGQDRTDNRLVLHEPGQSVVFFFCSGRREECRPVGATHAGENIIEA